MGAVQDAVEEWFADGGLTPDDLDSVLAAVRHHFGQHVHVIDPALVGDHIYLSPSERFVVTLAVSYAEGEGDVQTPQDALRAALDLTRDEGAAGTHWWVYDRQTSRGQIVEQGDVDDKVVL